MVPRLPLTHHPVSAFVGRIGACLRCATVAPLAGLLVVNGFTLCPRCRYAKDSYDWQHQTLAATVLAPIPETPARSLVVLDGNGPRRKPRPQRIARLSP